MPIMMVSIVLNYPYQNGYGQWYSGPGLFLLMKGHKTKRTSPRPSQAEDLPKDRKNTPWERDDYYFLMPFILRNFKKYASFT